RHSEGSEQNGTGAQEEPSRIPRARRAQYALGDYLSRQSHSAGGGLTMATAAHTTHAHEPSTGPQLVITQSHADVTRDVVGTLGTPSRGYLMLLFSAIGLFLVGLVTFGILVKDGLGHAGYQPPIFWAVYITTFVFWIGIGHAGTLISAILFLFRSPWRTAVYRSTEAMTVVAVMTAGLFPILHIGRQWIFYWLLPYPNQRWLWPNFNSPLLS